VTQHLCSKHDPTCYRCELRRDEYIAHLEEDSRRADRLQALIDAYAEAMQAVKGATLSNVHQLHDVLEVRANALLAAATPQEGAP
jgi:hypothetical protein